MSTQTTERQLDWSGAEVSDGELTVPLTGERSKRWSARIDGVLLALQQNAHDGWESVRAKKDRLVVSGVAQGAEADVRHFLESVVQEANASATAGAGEDGDGAHESGTDEQSPDARMTDAFRAFGDGVGADPERE